MKDDILVSNGLTGIAWLSTAVQTDEIMQYISLGLTITATVISACYTLYRWYKKAKEDGKITKDEINELIEKIGKDNKDDKR